MVPEWRRRSPVEPLPVTPLPSRLRPVAVVVVAAAVLVDPVAAARPVRHLAVEPLVVERLRQQLVDLRPVAVAVLRLAQARAAAVVVLAVADWRPSRAK